MNPIANNARSPEEAPGGASPIFDNLNAVYYYYCHVHVLFAMG
jgi:hypothetical protein